MLAFSLYSQFVNQLPVPRCPRPLRTMHGYESLYSKYRAGLRQPVTWASNLFDSGRFCVLDSETIGLTPPVQFVKVAIEDAGPKTLFEGTVRPNCPIESGATRIHGHTAKSLAGSPPFFGVHPDLLEAT